MTQVTKQEVSVEERNGYFITNGLTKYGYQELCIRKQLFPEDQYVRVLRYLLKYIEDDKPVLKPEQTIAYHSWILKFMPFSEEKLNIWEANENGSGFIEGVDYALKVLSDQEHECSLHGAQPSFPTFGQNIVISQGVYEGLSVYAVRYPSPSHMCGWWLTTDEFDGNVSSMQNVPYYSVAFKRPELLRYFALPKGYCFDVDGQQEKVWFDEEILKN